MTREELVKQKAYSLGQKYFPDRNNVWVRANFEAQWVSEACKEMAEWEHNRLVEKACAWIKKNMYVEHIFEHSDDEEYVQYVCASASDSVDEFVNNFRKAMEE